MIRTDGQHAFYTGFGCPLQHPFKIPFILFIIQMAVAVEKFHNLSIPTFYLDLNQFF
jgi:hypothetical protein